MKTSTKLKWFASQQIVHLLVQFKHLAVVVVVVVVVVVAVVVVVVVDFGWKEGIVERDIDGEIGFNIISQQLAMLGGDQLHQLHLLGCLLFWSDVENECVTNFGLQWINF